MDFLQTKILSLLKDDGLTKTQLTEQTGFHRKTVVKALNRLIFYGLVIGEFGSKIPGEYKRNERFFLKPKTNEFLFLRK